LDWVLKKNSINLFIQKVY